MKPIIVLILSFAFGACAVAGFVNGYENAAFTAAMLAAHCALWFVRKVRTARAVE